MASALITRVEDNILIVYPQAVRIIDETQIQEVTDELLELVNSTKLERMLINFSTVNFMGSAMIGKLILLNKKCKAMHLDLRFCGMNANILEVFKLMKLDTVFQIYGEESEAIKSFKDRKKKWYV